MPSVRRFAALVALALPAATFAADFDPATGRGKASAAEVAASLGGTAAGPVHFTGQAVLDFACTVRVVDADGRTFDCAANFRAVFDRPLTAAPAAGGFAFTGYAGPDVATGTVPTVGATLPRPGGGTQTILTVKLSNASRLVQVGDGKRGGSVWSAFVR